MSCYLSRTVAAGFDEVVQRVTAALKEKGFSILTDIDVQATLKAKLCADMPPHRILGACSPSFAHQALHWKPWAGCRCRGSPRATAPCRRACLKTGPAVTVPGCIDELQVSVRTSKRTQ
jgi:hypothetical protein